MQQPGFRFDAPIADVATTAPALTSTPPIARSVFPSASHASATGAAVAVECRTVRQSAYLQLIRNAGALSDHEAAELLKTQLCSVNSVRGSLINESVDAGFEPMVIPAGFDLHPCGRSRPSKKEPNGHALFTKRTRWTVNPSYRGPR